ncbi:MAG: hypothetical protein JEZ07_15980 [Phycisphaerae bacterium]|nr:hypothetical protein [Phycisphaerae bacterium]
MTRKFKKNLETKANELSRDIPKHIWDRSITSTIRREIALTVDQIEQLRQQHKKQFHKLLQTECHIGTELKQLQQRIPWYTQQQSPDREKFHQRLFDIEKERRTLNLRLEEKTRGLEDKLLSLINKHEQLNF